VLNIRHIKRTLFRLRAVELNANYEMYFARQRFLRQAVCVKTDKVSFDFRKIKPYFFIDIKEASIKIQVCRQYI